MERQEQTLQKQTATKETAHRDPQQKTQSGFTSLSLQAILDGGPVWDLPRQSLEELAERVGNSGMLALAEMRAPAADLHRTTLTDAEPMTEATVVPETVCALQPAADLTAGNWPTSTFDAAGLA